MAGTYSQLLFHIVFSTKGRTPWIAPDVAERLYPFIGGIVRAEKGVLSHAVVLTTTCTCIFAGGRTVRFRTWIAHREITVEQMGARDVSEACGL
jgi:hypothetical protein